MEEYVQNQGDDERSRGDESHHHEDENRYRRSEDDGNPPIQRVENVPTNNNNSIDGYESDTDNGNDLRRAEDEAARVAEEERRESFRRHRRRRMTIDPIFEAFWGGQISRRNSDGSRRGDDDDNEQEAEDGRLDDGMDIMNEAAAGGNNNEDIGDMLAEDADEWFRMLLGRENIRSDRQDDDDEEAYAEEAINDVNDPPRPARDHAYLPTAQPLYPEEWIRGAGRQLNQSGMIDEVRVSVGGASVPHFVIPAPPDIATQDMTITQSQTQDETTLAPLPVAHPTIVFPILEIDDVVLFPGSTLPLRLNDANWVEYLGDLIDDARGLYGAGGTGEVRIGILPRIMARRTRRSPRESGARTGRWRIDLIRRGVTSMRTPARRRRREESISSAAGANESPDRESSQNSVQSIEAQHQEQNIPVQPARATVETEQSSSDEESGEDDFFHPSSSLSANLRDRLIGRIGTMATITFTHEEAARHDALDTNNHMGRRGRPRLDSRPSSMVWQRHRGELVVTALGTSRFRIIRSTSDASIDEQHRTSANTGIPLYAVEEMSDGNASFPPSWMVRTPGEVRRRLVSPVVALSNARKNLDDSDDDERKEGESNNEHVTVSETKQLCKGSHDDVIWNLSLRSSSSVTAYRALWPWRLAQSVCNMVQEMEAYRGVKQILPMAAGVLVVHDDGDASQSTRQYQIVDPSRFTNWLASNMPLSQNDRLDILETPCVVQQLRYILKKIQRTQETYLRCKHCGTAISKYHNVFTVGGAEDAADGNGASEEDLRPNSFWGLSSVTTEQRVEPQRVSVVRPIAW
eukprot:scaffold427_cov103-Alexandrium_tamarense.AAC.12